MAIVCGRLIKSDARLQKAEEALKYPDEVITASLVTMYAQTSALKHLLESRGLNPIQLDNALEELVGFSCCLRK